MKFKWVGLPLAGLLAGCAGQPVAETPADFPPVPGPSRPGISLPPPATPAPPPPVTNVPARKPTAGRAPIVTPDTALTGKVVRLNEAARIVVIEFSLLHMPDPERQLFVYRNELKVGEVRTSRWQRDRHVVADLIAGEAQVGDVVRDR